MILYSILANRDTVSFRPWHRRDHRKKTLAFLGLVGVIGILKLTYSPQKIDLVNGVGVPVRMAELQREITGSPDFISKENSALLEVDEAIASGHCQVAYRKLMWVFRGGVSNSIVLLKLEEVSKILCATAPSYCDDYAYWKRLNVRLENEV